MDRVRGRPESDPGSPGRRLRRRPAAVRRAASCTDEERSFYVDVYERTGFTGGLNWYRALRVDFEEAQGSTTSIDKPALMISSADDWFFMRGSTTASRSCLPQIEKHEILDAAHSIQQEKPDEVNAIHPGHRLAADRTSAVGCDPAGGRSAWAGTSIARS